MLISGLQKLTLLDYPGRVACTVFTGGCNFRCPFCHNAPLVLPEQLAHDTDEEQVLAFLQKRVGVLDGVAVTGGEPPLPKDIDRGAMDIKNAPARYPATIGVDSPNMAAITRSKDFLLSGAVDYEFRTTVVKGLHTEESLVEAAKWIGGAKEYYLQQFKDSGHVLNIAGLDAFDEAEMHALADAVRPWVPTVQVRGV